MMLTEFFLVLLDIFVICVLSACSAYFCQMPINGNRLVAESVLIFCIINLFSSLCIYYFFEIPHIYTAVVVNLLLIIIY